MCMSAFCWSFLLFKAAFLSVAFRMSVAVSQKRATDQMTSIANTQSDQK